MTSKRGIEAEASSSEPGEPALNGTADQQPRTGRSFARRPGPPLRNVKRSEMLAQEIVEEIIAKGLNPGDLLPPEAEMLSHYGVGRASLREALRLLESQGLVTLKPGPGGG